MDGKPAPREHAVGGVANVVEGIEQRAIEVEEN